MAKVRYEIDIDASAAGCGRRSPLSGTSRLRGRFDKCRLVTERCDGPLSDCTASGPHVVPALFLAVSLFAGLAEL